jgi:ABC-type multidrug transport system fused ATPase/permease subunit
MNLYVQVIGLWCKSGAPVRHPALHGAAGLSPDAGVRHPAAGGGGRDVALPETERARGAGDPILLSDINSRLNESLQGMPVIQAMVQERHFAIAFAGVNQQHWQARIKSLKINGILLRPSSISST